MLSTNENNPDIDIIRQMKLLLYNEDNNFSERVATTQRFLSLFKRVFSSEATAEGFFYLLERGASTAWLMQIHLEMPEATAYRVLRTLRALGIIEKAMTVSRLPKGTRKGGPRPGIWAIQGASEKELAAAYRDHVRAQSPKYRVAERWVQQYLDKFGEQEVTFTRIRQDLKAKQIREFVDVAGLAAEILHERGIKVWR